MNIDVSRTLSWIRERITERSTWLGLATAATDLGAKQLGVEIGHVGDVVMAIASTGLVTATTTTAALFPAPGGFPAPPQKETTMSLASTLSHILGAVIGVLIPGASKTTTNLTTEIQNELAKLYGAAATAMANELKLDTTGMSGPDKVFAIAKALVATAQRDGFKGDLKVLGDVMVDVAQAAYRASEPSIGSDIVALAAALTANPLVTVAATLVGQVVQTEADKLGDAPAVLATVAAAA